MNFVTNFFSALATTPLTATAAMPGATMRIYAGEPVDGRVAESVKIGDPLTLVTIKTFLSTILVLS